MEEFAQEIVNLLTVAGRRLLFAAVVLIVGRIAIKNVLKLLDRNRLFGRVEPTVRTFVFSFFRIGLYSILVVSVIGILGVPMASIVTVLASAGVAVGLALQGALSNLAGGIMLMVFKPFKQGDFVETAGASGVVREVTIFYTVLVSFDNKQITVPNGTLMNANVTNYSAEKVRRVDLSFTCARNESPAKVEEVIRRGILQNKKVLAEPGAPFVGLNGMTNDAMEFVARVWCETADYWDVYYDLMRKITDGLIEEGVSVPAAHIITHNER